MEHSTQQQGDALTTTGKQRVCMVGSGHPRAYTKTGPCDALTFRGKQRVCMVGSGHYPRAYTKTGPCDALTFTGKQRVCMVGSGHHPRSYTKTGPCYCLCTTKRVECPSIKVQGFNKSWRRTINKGLNDPGSGNPDKLLRLIGLWSLVGLTQLGRLCFACCCVHPLLLWHMHIVIHVNHSTYRACCFLQEMGHNL